jgi:nucleoside-diphosphate-sugar epimerase
MNIFVTGANGFIGTNLIKKIKKNTSHQIFGITNSRIEDKSGRTRYISVDYENMEKIDFTECDLLIHLGAHSANHPYDTLQNCIRYNVNNFLKLFSKALNQGVRKFVVAGSCFEYGLSALNGNFLKPTSELLPIYSYPISKALLSIELLRIANENKNIQLKILRIFQCYGEGEALTRLWPSLIKAAKSGNDFKMSSGDQIRDFINVEDVADHFIKSLDFSDYKNEPIISHVASGRPRSLKEFASYWWDFYNAKGSIIYNAFPSRGIELPKIISSDDSILYGN